MRGSVGGRRRVLIGKIKNPSEKGVGTHIKRDAPSFPHRKGPALGGWREPEGESRASRGWLQETVRYPTHRTSEGITGSQPCRYWGSRSLGAGRKTGGLLIWGYLAVKIEWGPDLWVLYVGKR